MLDPLLTDNSEITHEERIRLKAFKLSTNYFEIPKN